MRGWRWVNSVTWADLLSNDFEIYKETTKTAQSPHMISSCALSS